MQQASARRGQLAMRPVWLVLAAAAMALSAVPSGVQAKGVDLNTFPEFACPYGQYYVDANVSAGPVKGCFPASKFTEDAAASNGFNAALRGYATATTEPCVNTAANPVRGTIDYYDNGFHCYDGTCTRGAPGSSCRQCYMSASGANRPSWTIDLGGLYKVQQVILFPRQESFGRLGDFQIVAHNYAINDVNTFDLYFTDNVICYDTPDTNAYGPQPVKNIKCEGEHIARFLTIRRPRALAGNDYLTFCDVYVIGAPAAPTDLPDIVYRGGNDGTVSCNTFCRSSTWGWPYKKSVGAYDKNAARNITADAVAGSSAAGVDCWCQDAAYIKLGNNGVVDCGTYCAGPEWPGGAVDKYRAIKGDDVFKKQAYAGCVSTYIRDWMTGRGPDGVRCSGGGDGLGQDCYCSDPYPVKPGNDGSQTCSDYCVDYRVPPIYSGGCAKAFDITSPSGAYAAGEVTCDYKRAPNGQNLTCYCQGDPASVLGERPIPSGTCGDVCTPPPVNSPNSPKTDATKIGLDTAKFVLNTYADGMSALASASPDPFSKAFASLAALACKFIGNAITLGQTIADSVNKKDPYSEQRSQLDQDMKANSEYVICKVNSIVSSEIDGLKEILDDQDLDHFNQAVNSAITDLKRECLSWNCLAFGHVDPGNNTRNAVAGYSCTQGFPPASNLPVGYTDCTGAAAIWNPDSPARCQYNDNGRYTDGVCGSDSRCWAVGVTFQSVYQDTKRIHESTFNAAPILNYASLYKYNSTAGAVAMTKGAWLQYGLLTSMALLSGVYNDGAVVRQAMGDVASRIQSIVDYTLDENRLAGRINKLSYQTGVPTYQATPDHSCSSDSDCSTIFQKALTIAVYNPNKGQTADTKSGNLVAGWGCGQDQALPESVVCELPDIKTSCQNNKCTPVTASSAYTNACASTLKASIGVTLSKAPADVDTAWSQDPGILMLTAMEAMKAKALKALTAELSLQLENVTTLVPIMKNISRVGVPIAISGSMQWASVGYPGYAGCDVPTKALVVDNVPHVSTLRPCPPSHSRPISSHLGYNTVLCGAGSFLNSNGCCEPCPKGMHKEAAGNANACLPCKIGWSTAGPGATSPTACNKKDVAICPAGSYLFAFPATKFTREFLHCELCPFGSFKPSPGNPAACTRCKVGFTTKRRGAKKKADCVRV